MKFQLIKKPGFGNTYVPDGDENYAKSSKIKEGTQVNVEYTKKRNIKFHRKFFMLFKVAYMNLPEGLDKIYTCVEDLRYATEEAAGFYDIKHDIEGNPQKRVKSISFASMDDLEFSEVYSKCLDILIKYIFKDLTATEFDREVMRFL